MTSNSGSWLGKLSGLSPRSKYESRDPSPPPRRRGRSQQQFQQSSNLRTRTALSLRPRSMSPFGLRRSRSRDNISESSFDVNDLRATEDGVSGGGDASSFAESLPDNDYSSMDGKSVDTRSTEENELKKDSYTGLNPFDSEVESEDGLTDGYVEEAQSRRSGRGDIDQDLDHLGEVADEPIDEINEELKKTSPLKQPRKQPIFDGMGDDGDFSIQKPSDERELRVSHDREHQGRGEDHPLRASQVSMALDDDEDGDDAVASYHFHHKQQSPSEKKTSSPSPHKSSPNPSKLASPEKQRSSPLGTHIDIHGSTSMDLLDTQRMAYDAVTIRTPPPKARPSRTSPDTSSPSSPLSSGGKKKSSSGVVDLLEGKSKSRINRFTRRPSGGSPAKAPTSTPPPSVREARVSSKRGSTPRGSSLDLKKPPSSPPQSTYVKHLETELETLRSDRSTLMQTILDLKQENEENAQIAARLDTDNGDERLSLSNRINELDEALQKANATIKLMRQANQTLKKELEEVKFENHSMRDRLIRLEKNKTGGYDDDDERGLEQTPRKRQSQSALPARSLGKSPKPPPPPPTFAPHESNIRSSHHSLFENPPSYPSENVRTPSRRRTSQSLGRASSRPLAPPPAPPPPDMLRQAAAQRRQEHEQNDDDVSESGSFISRPSSPPEVPPPLPSDRSDQDQSIPSSTAAKAKSPEQAPPPLPPPRSVSRGKVRGDKHEDAHHSKATAPPVPPPRSSSKTRKVSSNHFFNDNGVGDSSEDNLSDSERRSNMRSSESQLYQTGERKSEMRRSEPENLFRNPDPSPNGRVSMRGPSPLSRSSRPSPVKASSPRSRSASSSLKHRDGSGSSSGGSRVSPRSSSGTRVRTHSVGSSSSGGGLKASVGQLSDVEEQLNESSIEKDDLKNRINRKSPAQARIVREDEHVRGRSSTRKQVVRPPSPTPARRPSPSSKGSPMAPGAARRTSNALTASNSISDDQQDGNSGGTAPSTPNNSSTTPSTPRGSSHRRSLPRDSGISDLLSYVPTPRLKSGNPRSRSHTPVSSSSLTSRTSGDKNTSEATSRPTRSRSHTPSSSANQHTVATISKGGGGSPRVSSHRTSSSPRAGSGGLSGASANVNSLPTPWSAHPLSANNRQRNSDSNQDEEDGNASSLDLLRTSPDFHPASPPRERPPTVPSSVASPRSAFTTPTKQSSSSSQELPPRRLSTAKKPPKPTTPSSVKKKSVTDISPRDISIRHSESSFAVEDIEEKPFHQHRNKTRRSASGFTNEELENSIPIGRSFLASNIMNTDKGMVATAPTATSTGSYSSASSTNSSQHRSQKTQARSTSSQSMPRPPLSSPTSSSSSKLSRQSSQGGEKFNRKASLSPPRFKEEESVEEATARRLAYQEKCEREIREFQQSLQLEENGDGDEDLSYLKVQPRTNIIRRSASLDRERLEAAMHE